MDIVMPKFGWTMEEGTVTQWYAAEGDQVVAGQPLFVVETEKVNTDVEAPASGVLAAVLAPEGSLVPVGEPVARLDIDATAPAPRSAPASPPPSAAASQRPSQTAGSAAAAAQPAAVTSAPTPPAGGIALSSVEKRTGDRLLASWRDTPMVTLTSEADADAVTALRESTPGKPSLTIVVAHLAVGLLAAHPRLNAQLSEGTILPLDDVNLGFAVETERGLVVPVVPQATSLTLEGLTERLAELAAKARDGALELHDVANGSFTASGLGHVGIDGFTPIINPPQTAILGIGRLRREPVVREEVVVPGWRIWLSLTFDHRAMDGAPAGRFLQALARACAGD